MIIKPRSGEVEKARDETRTRNDKHAWTDRRAGWVERTTDDGARVVVGWYHCRCRCFSYYCYSTSTMAVAILQYRGAGDAGRSRDEKLLERCCKFEKQEDMVCPGRGGKDWGGKSGIERATGVRWRKGRGNTSYHCRGEIVASLFWLVLLLADMTLLLGFPAACDGVVRESHSSCTRRRRQTHHRTNAVRTPLGLQCPRIPSDRRRG